MALPSLFLHIPLLIILLPNSLFTYSSSSPSSPANTLSKGSSISVDGKNNKLVSPNSLFSAGFYEVGTNAYCFSIWFTKPLAKNGNHIYTVVWMANRDMPVNVKHSKLSLRKDGNLVLQDADHSIVWSTETKSTNGTSLTLKLEDTGNLVLREVKVLWQSFDHPTDTLLPDQLFTKDMQLISSRSAANFSSGFYRLYFENDNVLSLLYNNPEITSVYWPPPYLQTWEAGRTSYNNSRTGKLDHKGQFNSSDDFGFFVSDFGLIRQRIMKLDYDGNIRVYSLVVDNQKGTKNWEVQWQAISSPCKIHGVCGPNSLCTYSPQAGRKCTCVHGYMKKNHTDWAYGCEPEFKPCQHGEEDFIKLPLTEFYGYDFRYHSSTTFEGCKQECLNNCKCKGFQYRYVDNHYSCYLKNLLYNGYQLGFEGSMHIKLPKKLISSAHPTFMDGSNSSCPGTQTMSIQRSYKQKHESSSLKILLWFACGIGVIEILFILIFFYITLIGSSTTAQSYFPIASGFKRFTYTELKTATRNFSEEIGRGGAGVVYKGKLLDDRIVGVKMLKEVNIHHGEAEFQAEISTIGRLNHMNLIETWGYCIEGKHRLVVYEYMENGSLATCLSSNKLDWGKKLEIAIGTAKGLAYLHEECLEWVLHCDVKPHNILLDANYNPKVADFGLSKLFDRGAIKISDFSRIRGTRGYMAPEWVFNLPITSKVDVYSFGVVILEMITGKSPLQTLQVGDGSSGRDQTLVEWVRVKIREHIGSQNGTWIEEIVNGETSGEYDKRMMINMVKVALQCTEEDRDVRPSMSQVVNILLHPGSDY